MKLSPTGKPLCSQCPRVATQVGNYHLTNGTLASLCYCDKHAAHVPDALPLRVGLAVEPIIDTMLYWRMPITADAVYRLSRNIKHKVSDTTDPAEFYSASYDEMASALTIINPARFVGRPSLEARARQRVEDNLEVQV